MFEMRNILPKKLNEKFLITSENMGEIQEMVKEYNKLPVDDSRRAQIYIEVTSRVEYEKNFE